MKLPILSYTEPIGNLILKVLAAKRKIEYLPREEKPQMCRFSGGYYDFKDDGSLNDSHYYIADYMGNNRMVVNGTTGAVEQINHYYPYGGLIGNLSSNEGLQEFKFEDKELDRTYGLDWYDIQARQYDAAAPIWNAPDPLAEKYYRFSPYNFCGGNPVNFGDYNGMDYWYTNDPNQIAQFLSSINNGESASISKWKRVKDADFLSNLYYNDETKTGWYIENSEENGEIVSTAKKFELDIVASSSSNPFEVWNDISKGMKGAWGAAGYAWNGYQNKFFDINLNFISDKNKATYARWIQKQSTGSVQGWTKTSGKITQGLKRTGKVAKGLRSLGGVTGSLVVGYDILQSKQIGMGHLLELSMIGGAVFFPGIGTTIAILYGVSNFGYSLANEGQDLSDIMNEQVPIYSW